MNFIKELKKQRALYQKQIDAIDVLLEASNGNFEDNINVDDDLYKDYPADSSYIEQITYIIGATNRFLHNSEIATVLRKHAKRVPNNLSRRISAVLSKAKEGEGNLISITIGNSKRNSFWGSKNWLDMNGNPIEEHMYDKSLIVTKSTKGINI